MTHPDEERLVGFALGEVEDAAVEAHLLTCARCRGELARTQDVIAAAQSLDDGPLLLESPPPRVWESITDELGTAATPAPVPSPRSRHRWWRPALGVAAGLAVGVAATVAVVAMSSEDEPGPVTTTIADGPIKAIEGVGDTSGRAEVLQSGKARSVRIDLDHSPRTEDSFVQAWILDPATNGMVALGVMDSKSETFPLPAGIDLATYDSIDLSLEPYDGDPAHSAVSLARGELVPA